MIRQTTRVPMAAIGAYLQGKISFDNSVLEAISEDTPSLPRRWLAKKKRGGGGGGGGHDADPIHLFFLRLLGPRPS